MIQAQPFPITLAFPPQGHFTQPYLALPCLKAWLVEKGFGDVELRDLSVEAYDHFLTAESLTRARDRVRERLPLEELESAEQLPFEKMGAWRAAAESAVSADALIERIEDAKDVLRSERFYDRDAYVPAVRALYHGLRLVSAAHYPSELTPHNFTMRYANDRSADVLAGTLDEDENPFIEFFREHVLPDLIERKPRVLGLSVIYGSQLIPALTLGRMVKAALPDCHVTAGGGFLAYIGKKLMNAPGMHECLDSIIFHEGEAPLEALCTALRAGEQDLSSIGCLTWFDHRSGTPTTVENPSGHPIRLDAAPIPDFDGLPFEKYFSPELVIPYDINRGCYYGECTFCTLPTVIGPGYRTRNADTIAEHVVQLRDRHGAKHLNFITDCMPPGMIKDLPDELIAAEANITWWSDARVETRAYTPEGAARLYESGCRKLLFGFETITPRLLKMMKKGQSMKATIEVATNCAEAGISVTFYAMVGFPSETREEAQATLAFLQEHSNIVREVSLQTFHIDEVAETYRDPGKFGIEIIDDPEADLQLYHDYESEVGMTSEDAAEMFEEMMAGLRASLPLFSGDNIFYFMQKSHYFLHLAKGTLPDDFVAASAERSREREERSARRDLALSKGLCTRPVGFSYGDVVETLAHPLARAARPDFLTGRFVADAQGEAERRLAPATRSQKVLAYDAIACDFVELTPDGQRALDALERAGSLGALLDSLPADRPAAAANLENFARLLYRHDLLVPTEKDLLIPTASASQTQATTPLTGPLTEETSQHAR
ncbi:MAG: anaerobic magnesium-protoporphyrin IX monomethyl ester cyclase [Planctomycetota bacterium]|jgi:anaerobic magnesium-protoporphyrin IX monomethyl ester cyclase